MTPADRELGMNQAITRRDFLNGAALVVTAGIMPGTLVRALEAAGAHNAGSKYYPPALTGMRGTHDGAWEAAHALAREGKSWAAPKQQTDDLYDLVVVGGGISGLSAVHFFRKEAGENSKILILENHDDFGGHAKRNEFNINGRTLVGYGGSQSIQDPSKYSREAKQLLKDLEIDLEIFYTAFHRKLYERHGLQWGVYFDKANYGTDKLIVLGEDMEPEEYYINAPISAKAKEELQRLFTDSVDLLPGLSNSEKIAKLKRISYADYLKKYAYASEEVIDLFQQRTNSLWGVGIDAVSALDCLHMTLNYESGFPGLKDLDIDLTAEPEAYWMGAEPYIFHFPDGNASVARLLVRKMIPAVAGGTTMADVVTDRFRYDRLDEPGNPVRIRLNATAVHVRQLKNGNVDITYVQDGVPARVRTKQCVLACYNRLIPWLCPELPEKQKEALQYNIKVPLVYTNVLIRNWTAFYKLGVSSVFCPAGYHHSVSLDFPVSMGGYSFSTSPEEPMVLHLVRTPCAPGSGMPAREQHKIGRYDLLRTPFATFEKEIRRQLGGMLHEGGFDPGRDIKAITVNRWPHGYSYEYNSLFDPEWSPENYPHIIGRKKFGNIAIANADAGGYAYLNGAIDQAYRAVQELLQG